jgi:8-oxo-dGTP pyrophosphatase MutT (NUDIX family)
VRGACGLVQDRVMVPTTSHWHALTAAQARDPIARVPFMVLHGGQPHPAGSVARAHVPALRRWPQALRIDPERITLTLPLAARTAFFADTNQRLREEGLIRAWRDETYPLHSLADGTLLATIERAASRFWGSLTYGAHCNGYVADAAGRPVALWVARRSYSKPTDPGLLDNLIGGGVAHGQTPVEALVREGWEEAGLQPEQMQGRLQAGHIVELARDIPEGFQREHLSVYDLALPDGLVPCNQDGELHSIERLGLDEALALAATEAMTVDAGLVTLDFALRHRLLAPEDHAGLEAAIAPLRRGPALLA